MGFPLFPQPPRLGIVAAVKRRPTPQQLGGRIGGYRLRATHDPKEYTRRGREAFMARFYAGIPESLPTEERARRAEAAFRAYMAELSLRSARARSRGRGRSGS
jgi:hypothetical protein